MHVSFVVLSSSASIDQASNQLSIFGILEDVGSATFPAFVSGVLCAHVIRTKDEPNVLPFTICAAMEGQNDILFESPEVQLQFSGMLKARLVAHLPPFAIPHPGKLSLSLRAKKKVIGTWEMTVKTINTDPRIEVNTEATSPPRKMGSKKSKKKKTKQT